MNIDHRHVFAALHSGIPMTLAEAVRVAREAGPLLREGALTWRALIAAAHVLYGDFHGYQAATKELLLRESRHVLKALIAA